MENFLVDMGAMAGGIYLVWLAMVITLPTKHEIERTSLSLAWMRAVYIYTPTVLGVVTMFAVFFHEHPLAPDGAAYAVLPGMGFLAGFVNKATARNNTAGATLFRGLPMVLAALTAIWFVKESVL